MANRLSAIGRQLASGRLLCSASALQKDLVSHWKLDEVSGTRYDAVGNNNLADNNTVGSAVGKLPPGSPVAAQFVAASSEYLLVGDNSSLSMGDIDFTIAMWVYFDTAGVRYGIVTKGSIITSTCEFVLYRESDNKLYFKVANGTAAGERGTSSTVSISAWHFVVVWHDSVANTVNLEVDGTLGSTSYSGGSYNSTNNFVLGANNGGASNFLNGRLDSVSVWKRVLTTVERAALYNSGNGLAFPF